MGETEELLEPTESCVPTVPVPKENNKVRICVDLKCLNEAVAREKFVLPTLEDIASELAGSTAFSTLDAFSGFWQLSLDPESTRLTTSLSPFGRICFKRVSFGIMFIPETYQKTMQHLLKSLTGMKTVIDDMPVFGNEHNHESRLRAVLDTIRLSGLKVNKDKCLFRKPKVGYFGHVLSKNGMHADPGNVDAIRNLEPPQNRAKLHQILGMTNYLGKFLPGLSSNIQPLNEVLQKDTLWIWGPSQDEASGKLKQLTCTGPALAYCDASKPSVVAADTTCYGIGGAPLQQYGQQPVPVAYCSRTLTEAE